MAGTWVMDISYFLDENGEMILEPPEVRELAEYLVAIIVMASYPDPEYPPEYQVFCRRSPNSKPCLEELIVYIDPETDVIFWKCPKCEERGLISNWQGTIWDMSNVGGVH